MVWAGFSFPVIRTKKKGGPLPGRLNHLDTNPDR